LPKSPELTAQPTSGGKGEVKAANTTMDSCEEKPQLSLDALVNAISEEALEAVPTHIIAWAETQLDLRRVAFAGVSAKQGSPQ